MHPSIGSFAVFNLQVRPVTVVYNNYFISGLGSACSVRVGMLGLCIVVYVYLHIYYVIITMTMHYSWVSNLDAVQIYTYMYPTSLYDATYIYIYIYIQTSKG